MFSRSWWPPFPTCAWVSSARVIAPSRSRKRAHSAAISCHERHAMSVRNPMVLPESGASSVKVAACTAGGAGAVGRRIEMVPVGLVTWAHRLPPVGAATSADIASTVSRRSVTRSRQRPRPRVRAPQGGAPTANTTLSVGVEHGRGDGVHGDRIRAGAARRSCSRAGRWSASRSSVRARTSSEWSWFASSTERGAHRAARRACSGATATRVRRWSATTARSAFGVRESLGARSIHASIASASDHATWIAPNGGANGTRVPTCTGASTPGGVATATIVIASPDRFGDRARADRCAAPAAPARDAPRANRGATRRGGGERHERGPEGVGLGGLVAHARTPRR